jgi:hypothetical protein
MYQKRPTTNLEKKTYVYVCAISKPPKKKDVMQINISKNC